MRVGTHGNMQVLSSSPRFSAIISGSSPVDLSFTLSSPSGASLSFDISLFNGTRWQKLMVTPDVTLIAVLVTPFKADLSGEVVFDFSHVIRIGHRGSGSNRVVHEYEENTLPAFEAASKRGTDFVEFDIQLAADGTPVIYHDFYVHSDRLRPDVDRPVHEGPAGAFDYAVKQFTTSQFLSLGQENEWHIPWQTFQELLTKLPSDLQFDVEIKYPFSSEFDGAVPYWERNELVDRTLAEIENDCPSRRLFFSSFDPFVVTMLCLKQHRFPVFQLMTVEKGEDIDTFVAKTLDIAPLLKKVGVKGYVFNAEFLLKEEHMIAKLRTMGFLVFTYGDPNNSEEGIRKQLDLGIAGLCTDNLTVLNGILADYQPRT
jgi:glycerophosphoryl diester phosphodiesterase